MKKFVKWLLSAVGIAACLWLITTILHFGSCNMSRVEMAASHWRTTGELH